mgnify:CR=1 FL=1
MLDDAIRAKSAAQRATRKRKKLVKAQKSGRLRTAPAQFLIDATPDFAIVLVLPVAQRKHL